jgi:hypothetical protein
LVSERCADRPRLRYDRAYSDPACTAIGCAWDCASETERVSGHTLAVIV